MAAWRVRPGYRFGAQNQYGPGDLVELSATEAAGFADKLEDPEIAIANWHKYPGLSPKPPEVSAIAPDDDLPAPWLDFGDLSKHLNMVRLLVANGYTTPQAVQAASDEDLLAIKGIGPKALGALRAVLGSAA